MLKQGRNILLIAASLVALSGVTAGYANPVDQSRALVAGQVQQQININTASAGEIAASLRGVGLKTAESIVAYRDTHGDFQSLEALTMVKGVGSKTVSRNKQRIVLE